MKYRYHHIGLPTKEVKPDEEYNQRYGFYASGYFESEYGIEWLRFTENCKLHPLVQSTPHIAFVVDSIEDAINGKNVIVEPNSPADGVVVAFVEIDGAPIEFLQFNLPEEEIWTGSKKLKDLEFHHLGIKRDTPHKDGVAIPHLKIVCTDHESNPFGLQWMYYEKDAPYPDLVKGETHIAFKVKNLEKALEGKRVIIKPNSPSKGVMVAFIEENGTPIEFLEYSC